MYLAVRQMSTLKGARRFVHIPRDVAAKEQDNDREASLFFSSRIDIWEVSSPSILLEK